MKLPQIPRLTPDNGIGFLLLGTMIMLLGGLRPALGTRPQTWLEWAAFGAWAFAWLLLLGYGLLQALLLRQQGLLIKASRRKAIAEIQAYRLQVQAEFDRHQPDLVQVQYYYELDPEAPGIAERYYSIAAHQNSLRASLMMLDELLSVEYAFEGKRK